MGGERGRGLADGMTVTGTPQPGPVAAQVDDDPSARSEPAILLPRRRPGHIGPVHLAQLLLIELAVVAVVVALHGGILAVGVTVGSGALVLLVTLTRAQGRWWLERQLMTRRYRRRRTSGTPHADDPRLAELRRLAPGLTVENVSVADGAQVGVARDDSGWYAVAAVTPRAPGRDGSHGLPLDLLAAALAEADQPGAALQVVTQTVPAPSLDTHPSSPAAQSYRQLLASFGSLPVPADSVTWVAVRLDARPLAEVVLDRTADLNVAPAVVAALARRVLKALRHVGVSYRLLDADALLDALARACDLAPVSDPAQPAPEPREDWRAWHSGRLAHRSFWVRRWPPVAQASTFLDWVSTAPAVTTTVALTLVPWEDGRMADLRALIRVAAPDDALGGVCDTLLQGARQMGAELFALDGEQGPAVYASAPTGGGAR